MKFYVKQLLIGSSLLTGQINSQLLRGSYKKPNTNLTPSITNQTSDNVPAYIPQNPYAQPSIMPSSFPTYVSPNTFTQVPNKQSKALVTIGRTPARTYQMPDAQPSIMPSLSRYNLPIKGITGSFSSGESS